MKLNCKNICNIYLKYLYLFYKTYLYKKSIAKLFISDYQVSSHLKHTFAISIFLNLQKFAEIASNIKSMEELLNELDELFKTDKLQEAYDLIKCNELYENEASFLWRKSRIYYHIAKLLQEISLDKTNFADLFTNFKIDFKLNNNETSLPINELIKHFHEQGLEYAKCGLDKDPSNFATHKWYGILQNANLSYKNLTNQVLTSFEIKDHFMKALELNPLDATTYYCMGSWHFEIAKLSWTIKSFGKVVSGKQYTSRYQDALHYFLKAEQIKPDFYGHNLLMIARTYSALGDKKHCLQYLDRLIGSFSPKNDEDKKVVAKAKVLRDSLTEK